MRLAGLCDLHEEEIFRRGLVATRVGSPRTRIDMERLRFYVCVNDLDELIRTVGTAGVEALFDSQGDLGSFRSLQSQPAWRGRELGAQMRRFLGSGSRQFTLPPSDQCALRSIVDGRRALSISSLIRTTIAGGWFAGCITRRGSPIRMDDGAG